jgi:hypothetical protein
MPPFINHFDHFNIHDDRDYNHDYNYNYNDHELYHHPVNPFEGVDGVEANPNIIQPIQHLPHHITITEYVMYTIITILFLITLPFFSPLKLMLAAVYTTYVVQNWIGLMSILALMTFLSIAEMIAKG